MKLIADWRHCWRLWSVRVSALAALLAAFALAVPDLVAQIWQQLPPELLARLPAGAQMIVPLLLSVAQIVARLLRQSPQREGLGVSGKVKPKAAGLAAVIGSAIGAALLFTSVPAEESGRKVQATIAADGSATVRHVSGPQYLTAYLDIVRVPTACDGITKGIRMGQRYTEAQCTAMLEAELIEHAEGAIGCVPALYGRGQQAAAAVSLTYNIGVGGFCRSSAAKHFRAQRWRQGCDAFLMWSKAGGRVVRGLVLRRERERAMCLKGLPA